MKVHNRHLTATVHTNKRLQKEGKDGDIRLVETYRVKL